MKAQQTDAHLSSQPLLHQHGVEIQAFARHG